MGMQRGNSDARSLVLDRDTALTGGAQANDVEGLARLYGPLVFQAAYRVLGDTASAEDVQQDVFVRLLQSANEYVESWPGYLRAAATRQAIDTLRRRQRWHGLIPQWLLSMPDAGPSAEELSIEVQQAALLRAALGKLPKHQAQCFALRHLEGFEIAEIAASLGVTENNVSVSLHRARKALEVRLMGTAENAR